MVDGAPDELLDVAHESETLHGERAGIDRGVVRAECGERAKAGNKGWFVRGGAHGELERRGNAAQGCSVGAVADVDLAALAEGPAEGGLFGRRVGPGREGTRLFEVGGREWFSVWKGRGQESAELGACSPG